MRIFTFIVTSVFFAGASHRLFAGECLEAALGICIAIQLWIIYFQYLASRILWKFVRKNHSEFIEWAKRQKEKNEQD